MERAESAYENATPGFCPLCPAAPLPFCDGRCSIAQSQFPVCAGPHNLFGSQAAQGLDRTKNGWLASASLGPGGTHEFCRTAFRQGSCEPELHRLIGNPRILYTPMRNSNGGNIPGLSRE